MLWSKVFVFGAALGLAVLLFWRSADVFFGDPGARVEELSVEQKSITPPLGSPEVRSVLPEPNARDVVLDIEDPLVIDFATTVNPYFIRFEIEPFVELAYENNIEKTQFRLLPKSPLEPGQEYTLKLSYRPRQVLGAEYRDFFSTTFSTLTRPPKEWSGDLAERLAQAKKFTRPKESEGKYIDVNLEAQVLASFEDGRLVNAYIISSGKPGMETPKGNFALENKARRPWSKRYSLYMPYWMAMVSDGKFGIHELPEWPGGYKEGANHLGTPVSHGCIRLGVGAAKELYDWAEVARPSSCTKKPPRVAILPRKR